MIFRLSIANYSNFHFEEVIVFALYDINNSGSPELIIGRRFGSEQGGYRFNVCNVYTVDGGSLNRIIAAFPNDEFYTINTHSIMRVEGNIIETITEYSLSFNGTLIQEYSISIAIDCIDHEAGEILQESGKSLNDTPIELDWKRLSEFFDGGNLLTTPLGGEPKLSVDEAKDVLNYRFGVGCEFKFDSITYLPDRNRHDSRR